MIHVGVGKQHQVDGRQVLDAQAGTTEAAQEDESVGEDRIDEDVAGPADLDEERRVANECNAEFAGRSRNVVLRLPCNGVEGGLANKSRKLP